MSGRVEGDWIILIYIVSSLVGDRNIGIPPTLQQLLIRYTLLLNYSRGKLTNKIGLLRTTDLEI